MPCKYRNRGKNQVALIHQPQNILYLYYYNIISIMKRDWQGRVEYERQYFGRKTRIINRDKAGSVDSFTPQFTLVKCEL